MDGTTLVLIGGGTAVLAGVVALVIVLVVHGGRARGPGLAAGADGFAPGPPAPELLRRLGLAELVRGADGIVTWQEGGREVVAARTDGSAWRTQRGSWTMTSASTGIAYAMVAVPLPGALPSINVLGDGVLATHLDVESAAFNDDRDIRTDDERVAHAVLSPRVIALLQELPDDATVQVVGDHLVSFRKMRTPDAAEVRARAAVLVRVAEAIPRFVFTDE